jgi:hypothetical protein
MTAGPESTDNLVPPPAIEDPKIPFPPVGKIQLFAGVVVSLACFVCARLNSLPGPDWQSGSLSDYAMLLLTPRASEPLYPFLLYSVTCMTLLFAQPTRFRRYFLVRFGIFTGLLVAAEYWLILAVTTGGGLILISAIVVAVPWWASSVAKLWINDEHRKAVADVLLGLLATVLVLVFSPQPFISLICSTPWALAAYLIVAARLVRERDDRWRFTLAQLLGWVTWLAAHLGAWRFSFLVMLEHYSKLPTTPPERCFVCSAAARGHAWVVGGERYVSPDGVACQVNDQLRTLKAFELLMLTVSPRCHRACRWVYDRLGPRLAAGLGHPILADVAYVALKPAEWFARACLSLALPGRREVIHRLYRSGRRTL